MKLRMLSADEDLSDTDEELRHTHIYLSASPLTEMLAPPFQALRQELAGVADLLDQREAEVTLQSARAQFADDELNNFVDEAKVAILAMVGQDYQAPFYRQIFGGESPSLLKKPILGEQLEAMRSWPGLFSASPSEALKGIATRLTPAVEHADAVVKAQALARSLLDAFELGPLAAFVDKCNAQRQLTAGQVGELKHTQKASNLPADFEERFFLAGSSSRTPTIKELEHTIERLKAKLARQEAVLAERKEKEARAQRTRQEADLAAREAKLALAQKKAAEAAQEIAALKAEMSPPAGSTES